MRETSPDFREGFEFAIRCVHDIFKDNNEYSIKKLNDLLHSILTLMEAGVWWPDIKKVIIKKNGAL